MFLRNMYLIYIIRKGTKPTFTSLKDNSHANVDYEWILNDGRANQIQVIAL